MKRTVEIKRRVVIPDDMARVYVRETMRKNAGAAEEFVMNDCPCGTCPNTCAERDEKGDVERCRNVERCQRYFTWRNEAWGKIRDLFGQSGK